MNGFDFSKGAANSTSQAAWASLQPRLSDQQMRVMAHIAAHRSGRTSRECCIGLAMEMHCVSGRVTKLKVLGYVMSGKERRDRGGVIHATKIGKAALVELSQRKLFYAL